MRLFVTLLNFFTAPIENEDRGATVAEYSLLVALIAVAVVAAITLFGSALSTFFTSLPGKLGF